MTAILLPASPAVRSARPKVLSFGSVLTPFLGGPSQRLNRLGTRFAMTVSMPPMPAEKARAWVAALAQGLEAGVLMPIPQDIDVGDPGAPLVSAAVTAGMLLPLKGLKPGYRTKAGQFLSVIRGDRRYVHIFTADQVASGSGTMQASIWPMMRTGFLVDGIVEIAKPMIQGWTESFEWDVLTAPWVQLPDFTITEAE